MRHGIRLMTVTRDASCVEPFKLKFLQKVKDFDRCPSQVYDADESGFSWRAIPSKTLVSHDKQMT